MTDKEFINELVKRGLIEAALGSRVLRDAELSHASAENLLYERKLIQETEAAKIKSEILGIPLKKINPETVSEETLRFIPKETAQTYRLVPLEKTGDTLVVGMVYPDNVPAQDALRFIAKREKINLGVYLITPTDFALVFRKYGTYRSDIDAALEDLNVNSDLTDLVSLEEGGREEEAPIIKLVASTLREAVEARVSDIHIEPQRSRLRIRFRIDGELSEAASLPLGLAQPIISRVKVLASLKLDEQRIPQDGRFRTIIGGRDIDYRVATFPTPTGEKVAIRVLDPQTGLKDLDGLGLNPVNLKILKEAVAKPYGMILITGPTGSGKSTTLYAIMQKLNNEAVNIVSLEDPVEYFMEGLNQSQVKPEIGYDFASGLRQILRQDPDIIMVGEIRDSETAGLAVNAALTGHMMLSTLHTNNSIGVIPRLLDLGVSAFLLPSALTIMSAQRLLSRLCPDCREAEPAKGEILELIKEEFKKIPEKTMSQLGLKENKLEIYHPVPRPDCQICKGKGTMGRVAIMEIFQMTPAVSEIIAQGLSEVKLEAEAARQGMITLRQDGIIKALAGQVLIEEVLRETE